MSVHKEVIRVGDKEVTLEVGRFSEQAEAAVLATCGGTVVHATIGLGGESNLGYFPLTVDYVENLYAGGRIKGSRWVKRPGRPSDEAILTSRVIDRSIRPLFPDGFMREVQVVASVLSVDHENNPDTVAMIAAMAALEISSIPFQGPVAGVRVGYNPNTDTFLFNPTYEEQGSSVLDLILAGGKEAIVMVEAGALEVNEETMVRAFEAGHEILREISAGFDRLRSAVGKEKLEFVSPELPADLVSQMQAQYGEQIKEAVRAKANLEKSSVIKDLISQLQENDESMAEQPLGEIFDKLMKEEARRMTLEDGIRPDGRKPEDIREITCEVDLLPTAHGSAMFKRGSTQALTVTTLGSPALSQLIEDMEGEEQRHYIHHYNMPPYASGETGRMGAPKRREIGHGALAERALLPMIPSQEDFPYTIHVVSEIMSSNGSTSQASVCGSTLSLMAAGVPIKKPVAGIAMGLLKKGDQTVVLSDIQGLEDHTGDMDFKVAGTKDGITALQMDIKITGITLDILRTALQQAHTGRMHIMGKMLECIAEPRAEVAANAPKIESVQIPVDKIGTVIGPGGKTIKKIQEETGAELNIDDDGLVSVAAVDQAAITAAVQMVKDLTLELEVGMEFDGEVTRIEDYGLFVELVPGKTGLVHVSKVAAGYVENPRNHAELGDTVHVRVIELDGDRIRLSMLTEEEEQQQREEKQSRGDDRGDRGDRGGRGGYRGGDRGGRGGRGDRGGRGRR